MVYLHVKTKFVLFALATFVASMMLLAAAVPAHAEGIEQLSAAYTMALRGYEDALDEQKQSGNEIEQIIQEIEATEQALERTRNELRETVTSLYKNTCKKSALLELLLGSASFHDAVIRYTLYEKVERQCTECVQKLVSERDILTGQKTELETRKAEIDARVDEAKRAADAAQKALLNATHEDGAKFHQVQGNGHNCGATAFIMGVNMLLHENRFTDNVEVWKGAGFKSDSTVNLAAKGQEWLQENGLGETIGVQELPGDIHTTSELKQLLDEGKIVVLSSGPDSEWRYSDGSMAPKGLHAAGHWVVFYRCQADIFFCNDSSASADKAAGCAYTEEQMQQWLDGRSYHFATSLYVK